MKYIAPQTLSLFEALALAAPESSNTTLRSWLKDGRITVDGRVQKIGKTEIHTGQTVQLLPPVPHDEDGIKILFQDKHLIVVDKPEGILSVETAFEKEKTIHGILKDKFRPRKVYVVHRLDQDTSGVMLFALSEEGYTGLKSLFEAHDIERCYTAVVEGHLDIKSGKWESYLYEDANYVVHSTTDTERGQLAITHYEVKGESKKYTWLDLKLETGKKNQIRVHCQDAGHSVVGDKKYRSRTNPLKRVCLHAYFLAFKHPVTQKMMRFESPVPEEFFRIVTPN